MVVGRTGVHGLPVLKPVVWRLKLEDALVEIPNQHMVVGYVWDQIGPKFTAHIYRPAQHQSNLQLMVDGALGEFGVNAVPPAVAGIVFEEENVTILCLKTEEWSALAAT